MASVCGCARGPAGRSCRPVAPRAARTWRSDGPPTVVSGSRTGQPVLDRPHRLTDGADLTRAVRRGRRAGTSTMVLHLLADPSGPQAHPDASGSRSARVGFVVAKAVGPAVTRNRVKRRLRHLVRERLAELPGGALLVVRALPPAGASRYDELRADLDRALQRLLRERGER